MITDEKSLYVRSLDVESFFTNIPSNETTNNWVSDLRNKIFKMENSAKDPFSNF